MSKLYLPAPGPLPNVAQACTNVSSRLGVAKACYFSGNDDLGSLRNVRHLLSISKSLTVALSALSLAFVFLNIVPFLRPVSLISTPPRVQSLVIDAVQSQVFDGDLPKSYPINGRSRIALLLHANIDTYQSTCTWIIKSCIGKRQNQELGSRDRTIVL